jgi:small conductance mechanosensitive channel
MHNTEYYIGLIKDLIFDHSTKILAALFILIIGFWIIRRINYVVKKIMDKRDLDEGLKYFLQTLIRIALKILLIFTVLHQAGINTTSFIAALGAAGLAIGLALQGSLSNFAGGALILFFKPFKIGDFIEAQGEKGDVKEIQIFVTKLLRPDGKLAIIPNGTLANGNIINYTQEGSVRIDIKIGIDYKADIQKARKVLLEVMENHPLVLQEPTPIVGVSELGESSVHLIVRCWCLPDDYWKVHFDVTEQSKEVLQKAKINIPFPQREVRMLT